jgi:hypothetical protein
MKKTAEVLAIEKGRITESFAVNTEAIKKNAEEMLHVCEASGSKGKMILKPRIECIHSGMTRNNTFYPADRLKGEPLKHSGVYSWTNPYPKPMIKNHDTDTEPTGRIENAMYVTDSATGRESIVIIPTITDPDAIEKVMDGRYFTVSIGATTDAAICSICGANIVEEGWCGHEKGETYDGQKAYWIVGNLWFDECSWVNVPADQDAQVVDKGEVIMMEAFAEQDGTYYNLAKEKTDKDYILTEQVAKTYGLVTHKENTLPEDPGNGSGKEKEGTDEMAGTQNESANPNETVDPVENLDTHTTENQGEPSEPEQANEQLEPVSEVQEGANGEIVNGTDEQVEVPEADTNNADDLSERVKELEMRVQTLEAENQTLLNSNAELTAQFHKSLAERVVDLRASLGKPGVEDRDAAIISYTVRSRESLEDSLNDLLLEQKTFKGLNALRITQTVDNPAGGALGGETHQKIGEPDNNSATTKPELTEYEVLKRLFGGQKFNL